MKIQTQWKKFREKRLRLTSIVFSIFDQTVSKTLKRRVEKNWPSSSSTLSTSDLFEILGEGDSILRLLFPVPVNFPLRLLPDEEALWSTKNGCHQNGETIIISSEPKIQTLIFFLASVKSNQTKFDGDRERERERGTRISLSAVSPGLNESVVDDGGGSATVPEGAMGGLSLVEQSRTTNLFRVLTRLLLVPLFWRENA